MKIISAKYAWQYVYIIFWLILLSGGLSWLISRLMNNNGYNLTQCLLQNKEKEQVIECFELYTSESESENFKDFANNALCHNKSTINYKLSYYLTIDNKPIGKACNPKIPECKCCFFVGNITNKNSFCDTIQNKEEDICMPIIDYDLTNYDSIKIGSQVDCWISESTGLPYLSKVYNNSLVFVWILTFILSAAIIGLLSYLVWLCNKNCCKCYNNIQIITAKEIELV